MQFFAIETNIPPTSWDNFFNDKFSIVSLVLNIHVQSDLDGIQVILDVGNPSNHKKLSYVKLISVNSILIFAVVHPSPYINCFYCCYFAHFAVWNQLSFFPRILFCPISKSYSGRIIVLP